MLKVLQLSSDRVEVEPGSTGRFPNVEFRARGEKEEAEDPEPRSRRDEPLKGQG